MASTSNPKLPNDVNPTSSAPIKVLVLGMPRTGTVSMRAALKQLGFNPYHSADLIENWDRDMPLWDKVLNAKFEGSGQAYGKKEFDAILAGYNCIIDVPGTLFIPELLDAYPDAKIVLNTRPVDAWYKSFEATALEILKWRDYALQPFIERLCRYLVLGTDLYDREGLQRAYLQHYEHVREICNERKREWVEVELGEGWPRLCGFLGKRVPDGEYPRVYDKRAFMEAHEQLRVSGEEKGRGQFERIGWN